VSARRIARHAALLLAVALAAPSPTHADGWTVGDTYAAIDEHSALAACIVRVETGGTYDPYSVGRQGELGVAQLHPRGELTTFYSLGYDDPFSPYQAMHCLDWALAHGRGHYWSSFYYC